MKGTSFSPESKGFTLIEVVVALAIVSWVLGSTLFLVRQYADQRAQMRERFVAGQVAWNVLMEEYRAEQDMLAPTEVGRRLSEGEAEAQLQQWLWEVEVEPAMGNDLFLHRVEVALPDSDAVSASRSLYLLHAGDEQ